MKLGGLSSYNFVKVLVTLFLFVNCTQKSSVKGTLSSGSNISTSTGATPIVPSTSLNACFGDGVHDDTACLNNAINTLGASVITFPSGKNYLISGGLWIPDGISLIGNQSRILLQGLASSSSFVSLLEIGGDSVSINGLWLDYEAPSTFINGVGDIHVHSHVHHLSISNTKLTGPNAKMAILLDGTDVSDVTINSNTITGTRFGILVNAENMGSIASQYPNNITISNNQITEVSADAIEINSPVLVSGGSGTGGVSVSNVTITNNVLSAPGSTGSSAGFCIGLAGVANSTVTGNTLSNCKWQGIHIEDEATNITVSSNTISNTIGVLPGDDTSWQGNISGILLLNSNKIYLLNNQIASSPNDGIELSYNGTAYNQNCEISGNSISSSGSYGILVGGLSSQAVNTWIGPISGYKGNTTSQSKLGSISLPGNPGGTISTGNSGN